MYKPSLKYLFIVANSRSLWPQVTLIKYLNDLDTSPYVICQRPEDVETLRKESLRFVPINRPQDIPTDYDVAFSQSAGLDNFEKSCLDHGKKLGKVNIKLHNSMSVYNKLINVNYTRNRVNGRIHGICSKEHRSILHFKQFLPSVFYLNTGDPDWDYFRTQEFTNAVKKTRDQYGKKILLICTSFENGSIEVRFWKLITKWAEDSGFKPLIRSHPGREWAVPSELSKYVCSNLHRHVAMAAASHALAEICSTVIGECMMLGTKVGSFPMVPHNKKYGKHDWIDNNQLWKGTVVKHIGGDFLSHVPYVHTSGTLNEFLSSPNPVITKQQMDSIWGWPRVNCYSEYLFKCVEEKVRG